MSIANVASCYADPALLNVCAAADGATTGTHDDNSITLDTGVVLDLSSQPLWCVSAAAAANIRAGTTSYVDTSVVFVNTVTGVTATQGGTLTSVIGEAESGVSPETYLVALTNTAVANLARGKYSVVLNIYVEDTPSYDVDASISATATQTSVWLH